MGTGPQRLQLHLFPYLPRQISTSHGVAGGLIQPDAIHQLNVSVYFDALQRPQFLHKIGIIVASEFLGQAEGPEDFATHPFEI